MSERDMSTSDGLAMLHAGAEAARTTEGRRVLGELAAEARRALDGDDGEKGTTSREAAASGAGAEAGPAAGRSAARANEKHQGDETHFA